MEEQEASPPKIGDVNVLDLVPLFGLCCCITSLYTEMPDCCGSVCENTALCCNHKLLACKTGKEDPLTLCRCVSCECDIVRFNVCCKVIPVPNYAVAVAVTVAVAVAVLLLLLPRDQRAHVGFRL